MSLIQPRVLVDNDAYCAVYHNWLPEADGLCHALADLPWENHEIIVRGRKVQEPRRTVAVSEPGLSHKYSGVERFMHNWLEDDRFAEIKRTCGLINDAFGVEFNACLLNEYADGSCYIGYHSDKEVHPPSFEVVTVSLGGPRDFCLKSKSTKEVIKVSLASGDLCIMAGTCQKEYQHSVPKRVKGEYRIALTYRRLVPK